MKTHIKYLTKLSLILSVSIFVHGILFAQGPYNGACNWLESDGIDDNATIAHNSSLELGSGSTDDFTIECFFHISDLNATGTGILINKSTSYSIYLILNNTSQDRIIFKVYTSPVSDIYTFYNVDLETGWHHIAASFDNEYTTDLDALQIFLDGTRVVNASDFELTPGIYNSTGSLAVGWSVNSFDGMIDEVRISDILRYDSTYTIPSTDFSVDDNTRALWHFSEYEGSTLFSDATLNNNFLTGNNGIQTSGPMPIITSTIDGSYCGPGTVILEASASNGIINWYSDSTGGTLLGTGTNYTTPVISSTTTYYVEATNNGCTTASRIAVTANLTCTQINSKTSSDIIKVYPNPVNGLVNIYIDYSIKSNCKVALYNNFGSLIQKFVIKEGKKETKLDLSVYPDGLYLLIIETKKSIFQYKLIKD